MVRRAQATAPCHRGRFMKDQKRNLNPHKAAVAAMYIWGASYARQGGGSMDFWDSLREIDKDTCRRLVQDIGKARKE